MYRISCSSSQMGNGIGASHHTPQGTHKEKIYLANVPDRLVKGFSTCSIYLSQASKVSTTDAAPKAAHSARSSCIFLLCPGCTHARACTHTYTHTRSFVHSSSFVHHAVLRQRRPMMHCVPQPVGFGYTTRIYFTVISI